MSAYLISVLIYDKLHAQRWYILPQMIGFGVMLAFSTMSDFIIGEPLIFDSHVSLILLTAFTFSVGLNIAQNFDWKKHSTLTVSLLLFVIAVILIQLGLFKVIKGGQILVMHPLKIGWSTDTLTFYDFPYLKQYLNMTLLVTFGMTPIANLLFAGGICNDFDKAPELGSNVNLIGLGLLLMKGFGIWWVFNQHFTGIPFFYPPVLSLVIAIVFGLIAKKYVRPDMIASGKVVLSLVTMMVMHQAFVVVRSDFKLPVLIGVLVYTLIMLAFHLLLKRITQKKRENIVFLAGCWGLMCSSAITAMNAMKSASKNDGKSPALVTVPIIGIVLVNVIQWLIVIM